MSNIDKRAKSVIRELIADARSRRLGKLIITADEMEMLLDELEAKEKINAELMEKQRLIDICQGQGLEHRIAAEKRAEAAERRIAHFESVRIQLPQKNIGWDRDGDDCWNNAIDACAEAIKSKGIKIEGY